MPDPISATVVGAAQVGSSALGLWGANQASQRQQDASANAAQLQWDMYQQSRADMAPWRLAGGRALDVLMGVSPESLGQEPTIQDFITPSMIQQAKMTKGVSPQDLAMPAYREALATWQQRKAQIEAAGPEGQVGLLQKGPGEFKESPSYQFALSEGLKGQQRAASATGRLGSGDYIKDATKYAENMASTEYDNFLRRWYQSLTPWQSMAGVGQTTGAAMGANALATGRGMGQDYLYGGEAQAGQYMNYANIGTNFLGNAATGYLQYNALQNLNQQNQPYNPYYGPGGSWKPTNYGGY